VLKICLDPATDALLYKFAAGAGHQTCSKFDVQSSNGKIVVDSVCTWGTSTMTSHNVITFSADSAYHEDIAVHYEPPWLGKKSDSTSQDAKWVGACTAGMRPGDIVTEPSPTMPIALRMNILDMMKSGH
jgi:hypothetical protein